MRGFTAIRTLHLFGSKKKSCYTKLVYLELFWWSPHWNQNKVGIIWFDFTLVKEELSLKVSISECQWLNNNFIYSNHQVPTGVCVVRLTNKVGELFSTGWFWTDHTISDISSIKHALESLALCIYSRTTKMILDSIVRKKITIMLKIKKVSKSEYNSVQSFSGPWSIQPNQT